MFRHPSPRWCKRSRIHSNTISPFVDSCLLTRGCSFRPLVADSEAEEDRPIDSKHPRYQKAASDIDRRGKTLRQHYLNNGRSENDIRLSCMHSQKRTMCNSWLSLCPTFHPEKRPDGRHSCCYQSTTYYGGRVHWAFRLLRSPVRL
jgi:hypothetical protein